MSDRLSLAVIDNRTILTATGGFLGTGYTHTMNLYHGCAFAQSLCGNYCYAQHNGWITKGRPWGLYGVKRDILDAYRRDYDSLKRAPRRVPKPLRIYLCSSTDPYPPQEARLKIMSALLQEMLLRPPDVLVLQTRGPLIARDLNLIAEVSHRCELWVSITVETDMERLPGFRNHATPIRKRLASLRILHERGVPTQAAVSPLLPLADPEGFATELSASCDRVILDHYMLGDGSPGGLRTKRAGLPLLLEENGFGAWNSLERFHDVTEVFESVLGKDRVLVSRDGFNAVGANRKPERP